MTTSNAPSSPEPIRRTVYFSGRVQGVGFRYATESIAIGHDVSGYVRNMPDGRVELVVEGSERVIDRFLSSVHQAMGRNIQETTVTSGRATGEFSDFSVRL